MKKSIDPTIINPIVPGLTSADLESKDFTAQQYCERLAENTVANTDDAMETFSFSNNEFYNNMLWAENRQYIVECVGYDADYQNRSNAQEPTPLPRQSPDKSTTLQPVQPVVPVK